jgi:hypothetical protein
VQDPQDKEPPEQLPFSTQTPARRTPIPLAERRRLEERPKPDAPKDPPIKDWASI